MLFRSRMCIAHAFSAHTHTAFSDLFILVQSITNLVCCAAGFSFDFPGVCRSFQSTMSQSTSNNPEEGLFCWARHTYTHTPLQDTHTHSTARYTHTQARPPLQDTNTLHQVQNAHRSACAPRNVKAGVRRYVFVLKRSV